MMVSYAVHPMQTVGHWHRRPASSAWPTSQASAAALPSQRHMPGPRAAFDGDKLGGADGFIRDRDRDHDRDKRILGREGGEGLGHCPGPLWFRWQIIDDPAPVQ